MFGHRGRGLCHGSTESRVQIFFHPKCILWTSGTVACIKQIFILEMCQFRPVLVVVSVSLQHH